MAEIANQIIDQYATWSISLIFSDNNDTPIDLTGWSAAMMIRDTYGGSVLLSLSSPSSGITVGTSNGLVSIVIDKATTGGFTWSDGVYDVVLTDPSANAYRMVEGTIHINPGVTH